MKDEKKTKVQLIQELDEMRQQVNRTQMRLLQKEIEYLTTTDPITGAYSRRYLLELAEKEFYRFRRYSSPLAIAMIGIDDFQRVNDARGQAVGNLILRESAAICRAQLRPYDIVGRTNGEVFAIILVQCDLPKAIIVAERIRKHVEQYVLITDDGEVPFTISVGIAQITDKAESVESVMNRAEQALDRAKSNGGNRSETAPEGVV